MTTTGTYNFNPAASNLTLQAFARIGIRRTEITAQHMSDADSEANLLQVEISNKQPNAWSQSLYTVPLVAGTATYDLPARLVAIRDVYLNVANSGVSNDRIIFPLSTFEYDAQPNKTIQAVPTSYWFNRLSSPTITMWPVPDDNATYILKIRMLSQVQDASLANGANLDLPFRFLDVFVAGLAHRLSRIYARDQEVLRKADYLDAWANAAAQDTDDNVPMYVTPNFGGYYR